MLPWRAHKVPGTPLASAHVTWQRRRDGARRQSLTYERLQVALTAAAKLSLSGVTNGLVHSAENTAADEAGAHKAESIMEQLLPCADEFVPPTHDDDAAAAAHDSGVGALHPRSPSSSHSYYSL